MDIDKEFLEKCIQIFFKQNNCTQCKKCKKILSLTSIAKHTKQNVCDNILENNKFKCLYCNSSFTTNGNYKIHLSNCKIYIFYNKQKEIEHKQKEDEHKQKEDKFKQKEDEFKQKENEYKELIKQLSKKDNNITNNITNNNIVNVTYKIKIEYSKAVLSEYDEIESQFEYLIKKYYNKQLFLRGISGITTVNNKILNHDNKKWLICFDNDRKNFFKKNCDNDINNIMIDQKAECFLNCVQPIYYKFALKYSKIYKDTDKEDDAILARKNVKRISIINSTERNKCLSSLSKSNVISCYKIKNFMQINLDKNMKDIKNLKNSKKLEITKENIDNKYDIENNDEDIENNTDEDIENNNDEDVENNSEEDVENNSDEDIDSYFLNNDYISDIESNTYIKNDVENDEYCNENDN